MMNEDSIAVVAKGTVIITVKDGVTGVTKNVSTYSNLVTNTGLAHIVARLASNTQNTMSHMGLGSSSTEPAPSQTDLVQIVGAREAIDTTDVDNGTITYKSSFGTADAIGELREAAIFNSSTSGAGTMLSRVVFPTKTKTSSDVFDVTWKIQILASTTE